MKNETLLDPKAFSKFITVGLAEFTIVSKESGKNYSFITKKCPKKDSRTPNPPIWVKMYVNKVNGPGRVALYMGVIFDNVNSGLTYIHNQERKRYEDCEGIKAFKWIFKHRDNLPDTVDIFYTGRCSACGRKITTPKSIKNGIGPVCMKNIINKDI
jgi:hypothetical protein